MHCTVVESLTKLPPSLISKIENIPNDVMNLSFTKKMPVGLF